MCFISVYLFGVNILVNMDRCITLFTALAESYKSDSKYELK